MKIAIDATAGLPASGGVKRYIDNLIKNLLLIDSENEYRIFSRSVSKPPYLISGFSGKSNLKYFHKRIPDFLIRKFKKYLPLSPLNFVGKDVDVMHFPDHYCFEERKHKGKIVVTIHDLFVFACPDLMKKSLVEYYCREIRDSVSISDKILTVSDCTRQDVIEHFRISPEKIETIYLGYNKEIFKPMGSKENKVQLLRFKKNSDIPEEFILFVGVFSPRKNLINLVKAFEEMKKWRKNLKLILIGTAGWRMEEFFKYVERSDSKKDIFIKTSITDEALAVYYNLADIFVMPSFHEGFGLPLIESMASGTPVITANRSATKEIAGEAAMLVDPSDFYSIENAAHVLFKDKAKREELIRKGLERAQLFSWEKTAAQTLNAYKKVCAL